MPRPETRNSSDVSPGSTLRARLLRSARASRRAGGSRARTERSRQPAPPLRRDKSLTLTTIKEENAAAVHRAVLRVMWDVGAIIDDAPTKRWLIHDHGCREAEDGRVRFPEDLVARTLETVPRRITLYDRNGVSTVDTRDRTPKFCPGHNCVQVLDYETG